jgi:hypothetical protein
MVERSIFSSVLSGEPHVPSISDQLRVLEIEEDRRGDLDVDAIPDEQLWEPYTRNDDAAFEAMLGAKIVQYAKLLTHPVTLARTVRSDLVGATKNKTKELVLRGLVRAQEGISGERIMPDPLDPKRLRHLFGDDAETDERPLSDPRSWKERAHDDELPEGTVAFNASTVSRRMRRLFETTKTAEEFATAAAKAFDEKTLRSVVTIWGAYTWTSNIFGWRMRTGEESQRAQEAYWIIRKSFELPMDMSKYDLDHNFMSDEIAKPPLKLLFGCIDPAHGDSLECEVALWDDHTVTIGATKWTRHAFVSEFYVGANGRYEAPVDTANHDGHGWHRNLNPDKPLPGFNEYVSIAAETYQGVMEAIGKLPKEEEFEAAVGIMDVAAGYADILDDDDGDVSAE